MTPGSFVTALGFGAGAFVFYLAARRRGQATEAIGWVALAGLAGGVFGARLTEWALVHWSTFAAHPAGVVDPRLGGRTLIGGLIGGWVAVETAKWRLGIRRSTGDLFALALPAGEAVGRIGCFLNGCCYGTPTRLPWAVFQHDAWRHPAQLYSSLIAAGVFALLWTYQDRAKRPGELFRLYLAFFAASRVLLEFTRHRSILAGGLSLAQWVCLELLVSLALAWLVGRRWPKTRGPALGVGATLPGGVAGGEPGATRGTSS
jgi:phosphatidylglycerol:prolipoprotein diacylglycerol transferase